LISNKSSSRKLNYDNDPSKDEIQNNQPFIDFVKMNKQFWKENEILDEIECNFKIPRINYMSLNSLHGPSWILELSSCGFGVRFELGLGLGLFGF
jgi:hypothetical protein